MMQIRLISLAAIIIVSLFLLLTRKIRYDIVGILTMLILVFAGYITPTNALENFASITVIVFISAMIISGTLSDSGVLEVAGNMLTSRIRNEKVLLLLLLSLVIVASGFISDVTLTIAFIPLIYSISSKINRPPSKYLLPLAYSSILGGRYTIIGNLSNIIIANEWYNKFGHPLGMFQFAKIGLMQAFIIVVVIVFLVTPLISKREQKVRSLKEVSVSSYVVEAQVSGNSDFVGKSPKYVEKSLGVKVVRIISPWRFIGMVRKIKEGDILLLKIKPEDLPLLLSSKGIKISERGTTTKGQLFELLITSSSRIRGRKIKEVPLVEGYNVSIIGIASGRNLYRVPEYTLTPGDVILVEGEEEDVARVASIYNLLPIGGKGLKSFNRKKALSSLIGLGVAVIMSSLGFSMSISFLTGALICTFGGTTTIRKLYEYIEWPAVIFIGSYLSIGNVMITSGLTGYIASFIHESPVVLFVVALILANTVGYVATAIILAPIALSFPNPLISATILAMSTSASFITPFSHQANLIVYNTAGYRIKDFIISGTIIIILIFMLTFLIKP
ncbi:MAG: SLC13 family permease [Caldisphaeraceae archaeon]|nr:SLC13 family permease [Caldisphaeraceae archaeon]MEB3797966.1 SLC13 family permease [Caldisphaeraceae archaeon]